MHDWKSLSHVRWDCKYHLVIVPKYRKRRLYGKFRQKVGAILKELCSQKELKYWKGICCPTISICV